MNSRQRRALRVRYAEEIVKVRALAAMGIQPYRKIMDYCVRVHGPLAAKRTDLAIAKYIHMQRAHSHWPPAEVDSHSQMEKNHECTNA